MKAEKKGLPGVELRWGIKQGGNGANPAFVILGRSKERSDARRP